MVPTKKQTPQEQCDEFNAKCGEGERVLVKIDGKEEPTITKTRSAAEVMAGHTAVVFLEGVSGAYNLTHVLPLPPDVENWRDGYEAFPNFSASKYMQSEIDELRAQNATLTRMVFDLKWGPQTQRKVDDWSDVIFQSLVADYLHLTKQALRGGDIHQHDVHTARCIADALRTKMDAYRGPDSGQHKQLLIYPDTLTEELKFALGIMVFNSCPIAHLFRKAGHPIREKTEDEQAFIIDMFIRAIIEHGSDWREVVGGRIADAQEKTQQPGAVDGVKFWN